MQSILTAASVTTAVSVVISSAIAVYTSIKAVCKKLELYDCTLQSIIRYNLITQYKEFKRDGCTEREREIWLIDYERYHALHCNGVIDHMRDEVVTWDCAI